MKIKESEKIDECGCDSNVTNSKPEGAHYKTKLKKIIENTYLIHSIISDFDELPRRPFVQRVPHGNQSRSRHHRISR